MSNTTTEINWHNTFPQNLEGHKCIAVTKTGEPSKAYWNIARHNPTCM